MPVILKSMAFGTSGGKGSAGSSRSSLNCGLFIDLEHSCMPERIEVQADDVGRLGLNIRIVAGNIAFLPMRLQPASFQMRWTVYLLTPRIAASLRQLQCVDPSTGLLRVADRILARKDGHRPHASLNESQPISRSGLDVNDLLRHHI
jgi:hypothetical protein